MEIGLQRTGAFLRPIIGWGPRAGGYWCQPAALASQQARGDCVSSIMVQVHSCGPQGSGTIFLRQRQASLVARPVAVSLPRTNRYGGLPELFHTCLFHSELSVPVHNPARWCTLLFMRHIRVAQPNGNHARYLALLLPFECGEMLRLFRNAITILAHNESVVHYPTCHSAVAATSQELSLGLPHIIAISGPCARLDYAISELTRLMAPAGVQHASLCNVWRQGRRPSWEACSPCPSAAASRSHGQQLTLMPSLRGKAMMMMIAALPALPPLPPPLLHPVILEKM